ncbi:MAG: hypothetical protein ACKOGL_11660, partial [Acidimicrobiaceae bacterium]
LTDEWPLKPDESGDITNECTWWQWDAYEPHSGWQLQIAIETVTTVLLGGELAARKIVDDRKLAASTVLALLAS